MKILLVGGRESAYFLINNLKAKGHDLTVVSEDSDWCAFLSKTHEVLCVKGDGTSPHILEKAGAAGMDTVIAYNDKDSANLVVCEIAKKQFHIKRTVAIVNDPLKIKVFRDLGVDKCVSAAQVLTEVIDQESIIENIVKYLPVENRNAVTYEIMLDEKCPAVGKKLWELGFPENSIVCCIIRVGRTVIPQGSSSFDAGDRVVLLSCAEVKDEVNFLLSGKHIL